MGVYIFCMVICKPLCVCINSIQYRRVAAIAKIPGRSTSYMEAESFEPSSPADAARGTGAGIGAGNGTSNGGDVGETTSTEVEGDGGTLPTGSQHKLRVRHNGCMSYSTSTVASVIIVTEFCERLAYYGLAGSLVLAVLQAG